MNKRYVNYDEFRGLTSDICRQITNSKWRPDYVVGITRGGLFPAVMASHYFDVPMHTLEISLRDGGECESNLWMAEDAFGHVPMDQQELIHSRWDPSFRKNILIIDDINDSGATINWLLKDWPSGCHPKEEHVWQQVWNNNVRFATIFDNLNSKCQVKMDYAGEELDKQENDWIVFPYENWWV